MSGSIQPFIRVSIHELNANGESRTTRDQQPLPEEGEDVYPPGWWHGEAGYFMCEAIERHLVGPTQIGTFACRLLLGADLKASGALNVTESAISVLRDLSGDTAQKLIEALSADREFPTKAG